MKAFLLAAGFGERLKPLTEKIPKPLIKVAGVPSICYAISLIKEAGIEHVVCNLHYRHDDIIGFFAENKNFGLRIEFSIEEEILGTGGGLKRCEKLLSGESFVMINSDIITDVKLIDIINEHRQKRARGTVMLHRNEDGTGHTTSVIGDKAADFNNILKKDIKMEYDFSGISVLPALIFKYLKNEFSDIVSTGFIPLIKDHGLNYYIHRGIRFDIGTFESLKRAEEYLSIYGKSLKKKVCRLTGLQ